MAKSVKFVKTYTLWHQQKHDDWKVYRIVKALFARQDMLRLISENHPDVMAMEYNKTRTTVENWGRLQHLPNTTDKDEQETVNILLRIVRYRHAKDKYRKHYTYKRLVKSLGCSHSTLVDYTSKIIEGKFTRDGEGSIYYEGKRIRPVIVQQ